MSHSEVKTAKQAKSVQSNYESPMNRSRLLGWANQTLSKLKSDRNFLRRRVKKTKCEYENANNDSDTTSSKKDKCAGEEISELKSNEVATYVSEIVTSKMKRKIQHMAFETSIMREKQKNKASDKEHVTNTEVDENCDKQYKLKSKYKLNISCNEDQEGDLCRHEMCTRNRKKRKCNESKSQKYSAGNSCSESPLPLWVPVLKERPRKRNKLTGHYRSCRVSCCHFCKCASNEIKSQKTGTNLNNETDGCHDMECLSDPKKLKKCEMHKDFHSGNENDSASEKVENAASYKRVKMKKSLDSMLEKGDQLSDGDVPKEDPKKKKKEKRCYTHSVSEECISEKKKLKKYKLYTQKYRYDESRSASERESKMSDSEKEAFEGCCDLGEKRERKKNKHDHTFNDKWEERKNESLWHSSCKTEIASNRSQQKNGKKNSHSTVEYRRKRKSEKDDAYSESEIISEGAKEHSEYGYDDSDSTPGKRKKRKKGKQNCKVNENVSDSEERAKKKTYSDRNGISTMDASSIREKQKKKHKEVEKEKYYNLSVDIEGRKNKTHKENAVNAMESSCTQEKQKKKQKEVEKDKYYNLSVDTEEESKEKRKKKRHKERTGTENNLKTDGNDVNALETSSVQEKQKKKHKEVEKDKYYILSVDTEEESKEKRKKKRHKERTGTENNLKTDRNDVNAMETSSVQEKQKQKHKEVENEKYYNLSVDIEEESKEKRKKKRHKENVSTDDSLKTDEFVEDLVLLDCVSSNTKYFVKRKDKSNNTGQPQTEGMESMKSKRNKAVLVVSKEKSHNEIKDSAIMEGDIQYQESNQCPESTQSVNNFKENKSNYMQVNALHDKNIKQSRKTSNFGLSPIFRLLATEPDFNDAIHACQTCCKCKPHPDVALSESAGSVTENISNVVIKIEPGVTIKQEKEDVDNSGPHSTDQQVLAVKKESQTELNTDYMNRTDAAVRNVESNDISVDNLTGKEDEVSTGNGSVPNEYAVVKEDMEMNKTDSEYGIEKYVEGFNDECAVNGNKEADIDTPFHNVYDDKITVREEIYHLTDACYYQNDSRNHTEDTSGVNLDFIGKQTTVRMDNVSQDDGRNHTEDASRAHLDFVAKQTAACMGNISELTSVYVLDSTYSTVTNVCRTTSVQEVNGLSLDTVPKCEPVSLNEPENRFSSEVIPKAVDVQNTTWNGEEARSLYWPSVNINKQQTSEFCEIGTFRTGRVHFTHVPKWWKKVKFAKALGVPVKTVRVDPNYYGPRGRKKYISVTFPNPRCLKKIMKCANRIPCSGWFVSRGSEHWTPIGQRTLESFHQ